MTGTATSVALSSCAGLWRGACVGLLGGSFNPAHEGHLHMSLQALRRMRLDAVWWLVSPQNPLKPQAGMAPYAERLAGARKQARHPRIYVTDMEARAEIRFSVETVQWLRARCPRTDFVWLMGADNWAGFHTWKDWQAIARRIPIAILDRPGYSIPALRGEAALKLWHSRIPEGRAVDLPAREGNAWCFLRIPRHPASATAIRQKD